MFFVCVCVFTRPFHSRLYANDCARDNTIAKLHHHRSNADALAEAELWADYYSDYLPMAERELKMAPACEFYYPIINDLSRINVAGSPDYQPTNHELVGVIVAPFYWRSMIRANMPADSKGVVIVFESPCNDGFTYEISGTHVQYVGIGDRHDTKYDHLVERSVLTQRSFLKSAESAYSGAPLDSETCPITLLLYPSQKMEDAFTTRNPTIFTAGTVGIFLFTSLVFIFYDYFVERRQTVVLGTATRSNAIVSSLFPSVVRDQLYPTSGSISATDAKRGRLQSFLNETTGSASSSEYQKLVGAPIAELYPETTVFFADIAGFTSWSSTRSPTDVFHLLETLYGTFDAIADRHGVFKVETIGDSYVAVVGLPTPRKHHAVVMARFAQDCMHSMTRITADLEATLGSVRCVVHWACCDGMFDSSCRNHYFRVPPI
jgi:Adenylate and Guanylate cyclase catalytic domain